MVAVKNLPAFGLRTDGSPLWAKWVGSYGSPADFRSRPATVDIGPSGEGPAKSPERRMAALPLFDDRMTARSLAARGREPIFALAHIAE